jgi:vanillate O-demethylase ferredoxin subunit
MGTIVKNVWYVAGWSSELSNGPVGRRICDTPVALYRGADGIAAALEDRCCHRGLPLSLGRVKGNDLQCGYHGLRFAPDGRCVHIPGQDDIPANAVVQSFPLVEQDELLWIWMGDPALADPTRIVRHVHHNDPNWLWRSGHFHYETNFQLIYDNLLDLTHVGYIHPNTIGGNEEEHSRGLMEIERGEGRVRGIRWMRNSHPPAAYTAIVPFSGLIDRCQVMSFDPGVVRLDIVAKDAGTLQGPDDYTGYRSHSFHAVTPASETSTHYFFSVGVPRDLNRPELLDRKFEIAEVTFEEDRVALEAQQKSLDNAPDRPLVDIRSDALGLAARRIWDGLRQSETSPAPAADPRPAALGMSAKVDAPKFIEVVVRRKWHETERVIALDLVDPDGHALPPFEPGAHIAVKLHDGLERHYSLISSPTDLSFYRIAVLREAASRGGSAALHDSVAEGERLTISAPRNHFALHDEDHFHLLVAGGIGVTPLLCMAEHLTAIGRPFLLHYCSRSADHTPFRETLSQGALSANVRFHFDDEGPEQHFDPDAVIAAAPPGAHLYVCGPEGFMNWVLEAARRQGWGSERTHREHFSISTVAEGDNSSFTVQIASTGQTVSVGADDTIVSALAREGIEIPVSCEQGVCGTCLVRVLAGVPDHRDLILSDAEHAANDQLTACCSRALTAELTLDL